MNWNEFVKSLVKYSILTVIGLIITPYLVMIVGLAVMLIGAFSTSPTINLLRFRTKRIFKSAEVDVEDIEDPDKIYNVSWRESLFILLSGFTLFFIALMVASFGWRGIIYML